MADFTPVALSPHELFMLRANEEMTKFEAQEREICRQQREERAAQLQISYLTAKKT